MKIFAQPIIVLDTETTGFHKEAEVIEIGAICLDEWGRDRSHFSALIQPNSFDVFSDWKVRKALEVSKITEESLRTAPTLEFVRNEFMQWMNKIPTTSPKIVAFNAKFDKRRMEGAGFSLPWGKCLMEMSKEIMAAKNHSITDRNGRRKAPSLKDSCEFFGVEYPENAHRALEDAKATAEVAIKAFPLWRQLQC